MDSAAWSLLQLSREILMLRPFHIGLILYAVSFSKSEAELERRERQL
jgi:hypothetical protein